MRPYFAMTRCVHALVLLALCLAASAAAQQRLEGKLGILVRRGAAKELSFKLWTNSSTKYTIQGIADDAKLPKHFHNGTWPRHSIGSGV